MHNIARMGVSNAGAGSIPVRSAKRGGRQRHANPVLEEIGRADANDAFAANDRRPSMTVSLPGLLWGICRRSVHTRTRCTHTNNTERTTHHEDAYQQTR